MRRHVLSKITREEIVLRAYSTRNITLIVSNHMLNLWVYLCYDLLWCVKYKIQMEINVWYLFVTFQFYNLNCLPSFSARMSAHLIVQYYSYYLLWWRLSDLTQILHSCTKCKFMLIAKITATFIIEKFRKDPVDFT